MEVSDGVSGSDLQPAEPSVSLSLMFSGETTDQALSNQLGPHVLMTKKVDSVEQQQRRHKRGLTDCLMLYFGC